MLNNNDIAILDHIVDVLIEKNDVLNYENFKNTDYFKGFNNESKIKEFQRFIEILRYNDLVNFHYSNLYSSISSNNNTLNFKQYGGFAKLYQDELDSIKSRIYKEQLETDLAKSNIKANTISIENAEKNKWYTWINIAIGVLNLILLGLQLTKG